MRRFFWSAFIILVMVTNLAGQRGISTYRRGWKISIGANRTDFTTIKGKAGYGYSYGGSREIPVTRGFFIESGIMLSDRKTFLENIIIRPEFETDSLFYADVKSSLKPVEIYLLSNITLIKSNNYQIAALAGGGYGFFNIVNSEISKKNSVPDQQSNWELEIGDYSSPMDEINDGGWIAYYGFRLSVRKLDVDLYFSDYLYRFYKGTSYLVLDQKIRSLNLILALHP